MLDFVSLMVVFISLMVTNIIIFFFYYRFSKIKGKSFVFWMIAYLLHTLGLSFYVFNVSDFSIYYVMVQNILVLTGALFTVFGTQQLLKDHIDLRYLFLGLIYVPLILMEQFVTISINQRFMIISLMNIVFYMINTYETFHFKTKVHKQFVRNFRVVMFLFIVLNLIRFSTAAFDLGNTYEERHILNSMLLIFGTCLRTFLTFAILYIIYGKNQYQFVDLEFKYQKQMLIKDSEQKFKMLFDEMPLGIAIHQMIYDENMKPIDYIFLDVNKGYENHTSLKAKDVIGKTVKQVIPETESIWYERYDKVLKEQKVLSFSGHSKKLDMHFEIVAYPLDREKFVCIVHNTTSEINKTLELKLLTSHDYLTKLKNRREFIKDLQSFHEFEEINTQLILFDIDGFSIFNDAFGNDIGDAILVKVADTLVEYSSSNRHIYRVGGDSFAIILNNKDIDIEKYMRALQIKLEKIEYKDVYVSVTFAHRSKEKQSVHAFIVAAEKQLIKNKANKEKSHYSQRIALLLETLTSKYEDEKSHSIQVKHLCEIMGESMHLSKEEVKDLVLAGNLHDIGKIAIPEEILHKPAKLTDEEYEVIKTHAEIGYRILNAVQEYQRVALATLHHHERYDGKGYPKGLSGEDIPLFSRIIGVVDAYEAMVSDRVYRKALGKEYAINELKRCSGSQFDPKIVDVFIQSIL
jgi:diguanylate cyclase (GGDEF)-like protein